MADTSLGDSRLMTTGGHQDGLIITPAEKLASDSANLVLTRNAIGSWSLNRTAGGAETYNVRTTFDPRRIGEVFDFGAYNFTEAAAGDKGIRVRDFFLIYQVGTVALTTATLRLGKTVYADTVAPVQTDLVAATAVTTATNAQPYVKTISIAAGSRVWHKDNLSLLEVEAVLVMANTGTLKVFGIGIHFDFNFN